MKKELTFALKGKTLRTYNPETALEMAAKDFLSGSKDINATAEAFEADSEHETLVITCSCIDELCAMEHLIFA